MRVGAARVRVGVARVRVRVASKVSTCFLLTYLTYRVPVAAALYRAVQRVLDRRGEVAHLSGVRVGLG